MKSGGGQGARVDGKCSRRKTETTPGLKIDKGKQERLGNAEPGKKVRTVIWQDAT
jgi:hypothetical protein